MSRIQAVLNEFMPCGGSVCRGCEVKCTNVDGRTPDLDRMADALIETRKDTERLDWLEAAHTLHNSVEILYVVDGYIVDIMHHDGATCHKSLHGETLRKAIDALLREDIYD
jgi:hypothetical protein